MAFITKLGENQIAAKQGASEVLNITQFVFANIDGLDVNNEPVDRVETMPAPEDIMDTRTVTRSGYVNTNQVVYSIVLDSGVGDYDFNWVGLIDDEGVLIAATYVPLISKRKSTGGVQGNNLTRNFLIAYSGIQSTTAINVPAETWQIDFTARLDGIDERERLSNFDIYGHEAFLDTGWMVVRQGSTDVYDVLPGVGYVGGIRIASAVAQQVTVASPPASIWVDVSLQGDVSDKSAVVAFIADAVTHDDYTDGNGFEHYLTKLADIDGAGDVIDVRTAASFSEVSADDLSALSAQMTALHNQQAFVSKPIGEPFPVFEHITGCPAPSNDGDAKFIKLSADLMGSGEFNEGLLINELITVNAPDGSVPELVATAEISVAGSPMNGSVIPLINSMGAIVRPDEESGLLQGDAIRNIDASITSYRGFVAGTSGAFTSSSSSATYSGPGNSGYNRILSFDASRVVPTADKNRMENISAPYYMRIK